MGRLVAMLLIPRYAGYHHLSQAVIVDQAEPFTFTIPKARADYPREGVGLHLILRRTKIDNDFQLPPGYVDWVITSYQYQLIGEALRRSDELTADLLKVSSWGGKRPFQPTKLHHILYRKGRASR